MMVPRRVVVVMAALAAIVAAAAGAAAWLTPVSLFSAVGRGETLPLSAQYSQAVTFDEFLSTEAEHQERWLRFYEEGGTLVKPLLPRLAELGGRWHLLVVAEAWCTDAANSVPYFARLAAESPQLDLRILRKEQAAALLDAYPLDGRGRIPLVIVLNEDLGERGAWIERPAALRAAVAEWKADPAGDVGSSIRAWYVADAGRTALTEVVALLEEAANGGRVVANPDLDVAPGQCSGN
jgi:hypothetical protein